MGRFAFAWGVAGVVVLLAQALWRLAPIAWGALRSDLSVLHWAVLLVWVPVMAHAEGYRGFHCRFSPRVVVRALWLREHPRPWLVAAAPIFCMSLFGASKRGMRVARLLVLGISALIVGVRALPAPWRGIVDAGVVTGLAIGVTSILGYALGALRGRTPSIPPDLPESESAA